MADVARRLVAVGGLAEALGAGRVQGSERRPDSRAGRAAPSASMSSSRVSFPSRLEAAARRAGRRRSGSARGGPGEPARPAKRRQRGAKDEVRLRSGTASPGCASSSACRSVVPERWAADDEREDALRGSARWRDLPSWLKRSGRPRRSAMPGVRARSGSSRSGSTGARPYVARSGAVGAGRTSGTRPFVLARPSRDRGAEPGSDRARRRVGAAAGGHRGVGLGGAAAQEYLRPGSAANAPRGGAAATTASSSTEIGALRDRPGCGRRDRFVWELFAPGHAARRRPRPSTPVYSLTRCEHAPLRRSSGVGRHPRALGHPPGAARLAAARPRGGRGRGCYFPGGLMGPRKPRREVDRGVHAQRGARSCACLIKAQVRPSRALPARRRRRPTRGSR